MLERIIKTDDARFKTWHQNIQCHDSVVLVPHTTQEVAEILRDPQRYPSPVRPMGSRHSVTACMAAERVHPSSTGSSMYGTAVDMTKLDSGQPLRFNKGKTEVTVSASRKLLDVSLELREQHGLQFPMISEFGSLTMGAAACAATKQSSFGTESGQMSSYAVSMELVLPDGSLRTLYENEPEFSALRCSFGLFGVVTRVTFKVVPSEQISVEHFDVCVHNVAEKSSQWLASGAAVFLYMFPSTGRIVAAVKNKAPGPPVRSAGLKARNWVWRRGLGLPRIAGGVEDWLTFHLLKRLRYARVSAVDQIVDFELEARKFTFSMWAFRSDQFFDILPDYFKLCKKWREKGVANRLPDVSYHIARDRSALLSYSHDSDVWTLDPASLGDERDWPYFLDDFNELCSRNNGLPLLNQSPRLGRHHLQHAYDQRLVDFNAWRKHFDPTDRMLNRYFAAIL